MIQSIDDQIKKIEELKIKRSKLLDVVSTFDTLKKDKTEEAKLLSFFKMEYPALCKSICQQVKNGSIVIEPHNYDYNYAIKQLLEYKILFKINNKLIRGDKFDDYMKFVLCED